MYTFQVSKLDTWQVLKMSHPNQNSFITQYCSTDSPNTSIGVSCLLIHAIHYNNVILYTFIPIMLTWQHSCILTTAPFLPLFPSWLYRPHKWGQFCLSISHLSPSKFVQVSMSRSSLVPSCGYVFKKSYVWVDFDWCQLTSNRCLDASLCLVFNACF